MITDYFINNKNGLFIFKKAKLFLCLAFTVWVEESPLLREAW
jgi:hypothetical protein